MSVENLNGWLPPLPFDASDWSNLYELPAVKFIDAVKVPSKTYLFPAPVDTTVTAIEDVDPLPGTKLPEGFVIIKSLKLPVDE